MDWPDVLLAAGSFVDRGLWFFERGRAIAVAVIAAALLPPRE